MENEIKISKMTGKLFGVPSINTNPLSNPFCIKMSKTDSICKQCYSIGMLKRFRMSCIPSFQHNSEILMESIIKWRNLPVFKEKIVRFNSHGELLNRTNYLNYVRIAQKNPGTRFALWSKRKDIIKNKMIHVDNLILVYSELKINKIDLKIPRGFDKVFAVYDEDFAKENNIKINCGGRKCMRCLLCYRNNGPKFIRELIK